MGALRAFKTGSPLRRKKADINRTMELCDALDLLDDPVVIFDQNWRYLFVNKAGWKVLDRKKEDVIGKNVWKLLPHLRGSTFEKAATEAAEKQQNIQVEEYYPHTQRWMQIKFFPSKTRLVAHITDITTLKQAEQMNAQLMGDLHEAMEVYWSTKNRSLREKLAKKNIKNKRR